ncbi:Rieske 2Fe-2S domain-containing protein [Pseudomaricurvus alkylphenolicus]|jgi:nitrite reductase/ring-hydroxylating ferredoxin subunit|uniref:Rieske (2Fe-2S) protein n=1 Tax=Pseudomaricurvus alkylphenolicus TaxID=1306991 RepID=UPI00141ED839|nr:Rieske 2Fe-2S domain-containing protein [Pseudomaricurvus alkylphenolicus]NIB40384.1 Rieske 2Fe-2S domain-containing protein [Pseudomaricurvus alkylphenolicus]
MNWREMCFAPAAGTRLANLAELQEGRVREAMFGSGKDAFRLLLMREGDAVRVWLNRCPHFGIPLNNEPNRFVLLPERKIMCAFHCAVFRIDDGHCEDGPVKGDTLTPIEIQIDERGDILIAAEPT